MDDNDEVAKAEDVALTVVKGGSLDDWWLIERAEHDGRQWLERTGPNSMALRCSSRITNADIEGTSLEMLAVAGAIVGRIQIAFKRVGVNVTAEGVELWSPRNSTYRCRVPYARAMALADEIVVKITKAAK